MIRFFQRRRAIKSYVLKGSQELRRRFGIKRWYSVEEVSSSVEEAGLSTAFVAYAHAVFCNRDAFDAFYGALKLRSTYDGLRNEVSCRFLGGARDFTAQAVVEAFDSQRCVHFRESNLAIRSGEDGRPDWPANT